MNLRLDDDGTTVVTTYEYARLTRIIYFATQEVDMYLANKYLRVDLQNSYLIYYWASIIAAYRLTQRRCGNVPQSLQSEYEGVMELLLKIQRGELPIAGMPGKNGVGISLSNVRMDPFFRTKGQRVETQISDSTPTAFRQDKDVGSVLFDENLGVDRKSVV